MQSNNYANSLSFEHFCVHFLNTKQGNNFTFRHWSNVSHQDLYECGYIHDFNYHRKKVLNSFKEGNCVRDVGVDFIGKSNTNDSFIAGQAKLYEGKVNLQDACTWISKTFIMKHKNAQSTGLLCTTNGISNELHEDIQAHKFSHTQLPKEEFLSYVNNIQKSSQKVDESNVKLREYQIECIDSMIKHTNDTLEEECKIILNLTCALGKTLIIGKYLKIIKPSCIIAMAPIRSEVDNLYQRIPTIIDDNSYETLLFDCDNNAEIITLVNKAIECIKSNKKLIIFTTYKTAAEKIHDFLYCNSDVSTSKVRNMVSKAFLVADEVHQLSIRNTRLLKLLNESKKCIFATATLPSYFSTYYKYTHLIDKYNFKFAIENNFVVDYKFMIPMKLSSHESLEEVYSLIENIDKSIVQKAAFLLKGMLQCGSKRCIVYLNSIQDCKDFGLVFQKIANDYHGRVADVYRVNSDISCKERELVFKSFENGDDNCLKIITSCDCLNQSVNLIRCDSTYITNISKDVNMIVMFQRFMRAMRLDPRNPTKMNHCFLYCCDDEFDDLEECITKLKHEIKDSSFNSRVVIINQTYDSQVQESILTQQKIEQDLMSECLVSWVSKEELRLTKIKGLLDFVERNNKVPSSSDVYTYEGLQFKLGKLWEKIKAGQHKELYKSILSGNDLIREYMERLYIERVNKALIPKLSVDQKADGLVQFVVEHNRVPKYDEMYTYKNIEYNVGEFLDGIKQGKNNTIRDKLCIANPVIKLDLEKFLLRKQERDSKEKLTLEEKAKHLLDFVKDNQRTPHFLEETTFKIGQFWYGIKQGHNKEFYQAKLSSNEILKGEYDKAIKERLERADKPTYNPYEKGEILIDFVNKNSRHPSNKEMYKDIKVGQLWQFIKAGGHKEVYDSLLVHNVFLKQNFDEVQTLRNENTNKKKLSFEEKCSALLAFVQESNKVPSAKTTIIYNTTEFQVGRFYDNIKQGQNKAYYESILSKNSVIKADFERAQKVKEEKKSA